MPVLGLTGNIASGKSLVTQILKELGARVIDADLIAREVVRPGTAQWRQIREVFGGEVCNPDGTVNREVLGRRIFNDPRQMKKLNAITHPVIVQKIKAEIDAFRAQGNVPAGVLVVDAPLLIETGLHRLVDEVWLVTVPEETQVERLMVRDGLTREQALARVRSQMPVEEKKRYARVVIDNTGGPELTGKLVRNLMKQRFGESGVEDIGGQQA